MLLIVVRFLYAAICAGAFAALVNVTYPEGTPAVPLTSQYPITSFLVLMTVSQLVTVVDMVFRRKRIEVITAIYFGVLVGVLLVYLSFQALQPLIAPENKGVTLTLLSVILPYICTSLLLQTKDRFRFIIPYVEFVKEVKGGRPFLLDTSALIDGRVADLIDTKIIDSPMLVPSFVLQELQDIADSNDKLRRNRGRRGLDVLSKLQGNQNVEVKLYEVKQGEVKASPVDQKLVELAKKLGGRVVTNDFNLNKVASVQGVDVVNLNDVANALKPRYLPGEKIVIKIIKPGESLGQGVGYLDDGTMVVCEQGNTMIGKDVDIIVTSVLQSSAGRMIFGRLANAAGN
ncbi:MAG: PIN/TRAM domain-containing protein [Planctomycetales bacterium]|nr:PIN/TRAM domain-containing protein [Planctomycetales bacterium]